MSKKTKNILTLIIVILALSPLCYALIMNSGFNNKNNLIGEWVEQGVPKHSAYKVEFKEDSAYVNNKRINKYTVENTRRVSFIYGSKRIECDLMGRDRLVCKNLSHYKVSLKK